MASVLQSILTIIILAEFVAGSFANVFIAVVNCADWMKGRRLSSADGMLTALAVSRTLFLWVVFLSWFFTLLNPEVYSSLVVIIALIAWIITSHFSSWLATSLSVFYLFKIANFSNFIFLQLKRRVSSVILVILSGSFMLLLSDLGMIYVTKAMRKKEKEGNITWKTKLSDAVALSSVTVFTLVNSISFITSLVCFLLLLYSLCKHLRRMRLHGRRPQDPSTRIHVKAVQTVFSFLLLFAIYSVSVILASWSFNSFQNKLVSLLCQAPEMLYPSGHSFILIWGNKKLKENFLLVVWQVRCWVKDQKPSGRAYQ